MDAIRFERRCSIVKINTVIFDVDGVFTDGSFFYTEDGKVAKRFGPHDADGIKLLQASGLSVSCITADHRGLGITRARCDDMRLPVILVRELERLGWFAKLPDLLHTCFMGDGRYDAQIFDRVAYAIAPANALDITKDKASFVTSSRGGDGAVYEACIHILELIRSSCENQ